MTNIITAAGLTVTDAGLPVFRDNGSIVTLKKISEEDWLMFGDLAEGDSEGFVGGQSIVLEWSGSPTNVTRTSHTGGQWQDDRIERHLDAPTELVVDNPLVIGVVHRSGYTGAISGLRRLSVYLTLRGPWEILECRMNINGVDFVFGEFEGYASGGGRWDYSAHIDPVPTSPIDPDGPNQFSGYLDLMPI